MHNQMAVPHAGTDISIDLLGKVYIISDSDTAGHTPLPFSFA
jgi:hypothetical protein